MTITRLVTRSGITLLAAVLALSLAACKKEEGPAERAGKAVDNAVEKAGEKIDEAREKVKEAVDEAKK